MSGILDTSKGSSLCASVLKQLVTEDPKLSAPVSQVEHIHATLASSGQEKLYEVALDKVFSRHFSWMLCFGVQKVPGARPTKLLQLGQPRTTRVSSMCIIFGAGFKVVGEIHRHRDRFFVSGRSRYVRELGVFGRGGLS